MTLREYLQARDETITAFASRIGEKRETVSYLVNGRRYPSSRVMLKIYHATGKLVTMEDYAAPTPSQDAA